MSTKKENDSNSDEEGSDKGVSEGSNDDAPNEKDNDAPKDGTSNDDAHGETAPGASLCVSEQVAPGCSEQEALDMDGYEKND
jgi:hypothetical protein